jgi:hypothetical protein
MGVVAGIDRLRQRVKTDLGDMRIHPKCGATRATAWPGAPDLLSQGAHCHLSRRQGLSECCVLTSARKLRRLVPMPKRQFINGAGLR